MQLVFVHGVATRSTQPYVNEVARRDQLFKEVAFPGVLKDKVENPAWGDLVGKPAWNGESLPKPKSPGETETFSLGKALGMGSAAAAGTANLLADLAKRDLPAAVDALIAAYVEKAENLGRVLTPEELKLFKAATAYLASNPDNGWVNVIMTDEGFAYELQKRFPAGESFGLANKLKEAATRVADRARNHAANALTAAFRDDLNPAVAKFLGDVFVYLKDGELRTKIRACVADALTRAYAIAQAKSEPLIVMGHSMGGVILVDLLSDPNAAGIDDVVVDLLVTVGSQPGFFEEHKLFAASDHSVGAGKPASTAARPAKAKDWWSVYDPVDILSFRCEQIFDGVEDFDFSSGVGLLDAHTAYFKRPKFFERLSSRVTAAGLMR